ncbi:MAG: hypothetical protein AMS21_09975 [Gemmatimonas sp. SG8_38_2]|nr:MAG: hypothetical protein AMS21_09975 [Gemmatimonas sp. SG8_38_2]
MGLGSLFSLALLVADVWAILNIFQSNTSMGGKVLWTALILVLPGLGFIVWVFAGPRSSR